MGPSDLIVLFSWGWFLIYVAMALVTLDLVAGTLLMHLGRHAAAAQRTDRAAFRFHFALMLPATRLVDRVMGGAVRARLAMLLADDGRLELAGPWARRAIPLARSSIAKAHLVAIAAAAQRRRDPVAAAERLARFHDQADDAARGVLSFRRAELAMEHGDWDEMSRALEAAAELPAAPWRAPMEVLGALARGDIEGAVRVMEGADPEALHVATRAWVLFQAGRGAELDALLDAEAAAVEDDAVLLAVAAMRAAQRGMPELRRERTARALEVLSVARPAGPRSDFHAARMGLARAALAAGEPSEALSLIDPAEPFSRTPRARHRVACLRARALEALGRLQWAVPAYEEAARQGDFEWTADAIRRLATLRGGDARER